MDANGYTGQHIIIRSDKKKVFFITFLAAVGIILGIFATHMFMLFMGVNIIEIVNDLKEVLGQEKQEAQTSKLEMLKPIGILLGLFLLTAIAIINMKFSGDYLFYQDKLVTPSNEQISYQNITRVIYDNGSITQNVFNYGTLKIEAGGTDKESIDVPFIGDVEENAKQLQQVLYNFKVWDAQRKQQQTNINNIVDQW